MSQDHSNVKHHPLLQEDSPEDSPLCTPVRGLSPDRLIPDDIDMETFTSPPDPALNLLEVPNTNWTRTVTGGNAGGSPSSSLGSSTCDMSAGLYDADDQDTGLMTVGDVYKSSRI